MKVLVTGATGLIGRALVPILVGRGDTVSVLSRSGEKARATSTLWASISGFGMPTTAVVTGKLIE